MKANRRAKDRLGDEAAMGIGAMIVFIAMVVVAAVAAAVLINTAGNLQRKSLETGKEAQAEVAANIFFRDIVGKTDANYTVIEEVYYYLALAPGSEPIDLRQSVIRWNSKDVYLDVLNASDTVCPNTTALTDGFCVVDVKDTGDGEPWVLNEGDRVKLKFVLGTGEKVGPRDLVEVLFIPEVGSPVIASFKAPSTFGNKQHHSLL